MGHLYGHGPFTSARAYRNGPSGTGEGAGDPLPQACLQCPDHREPSLNTVIYGDTRKGYLPAGTYGFTQEGAVVDSITGRMLGPNALLARTQGPRYGATMGACVPRAVQSSLMNQAGWFSPIPSTLSRGCYL